MKFGGTTSIEGSENLTAGRDITIIASVAQPNSPNDFEHMDDSFRRNVDANQEVIRSGSATKFSSEALFTSLMRIGVSYSDALEITAGVITTLTEWKTGSVEEWRASTADIRNAVMRVFSAIGTNRKLGKEQVGFWFAAYIRRYGNPINDCIKVIDYDQSVDLNFEYIKEKILPHLFSRIIGLDRTENPLEKYADIVFSGETKKQMARAVVDYTKELNVYSLRYKTLIHLLQDLVLEPPHPWIVNQDTIDRVTRYNVERGIAHFKDVNDDGKEYGFEYSARECMQHMCAAVLSKYGAFLGVDHKYGLLEFHRILNLQGKSNELWECCRLNQLIPDMKVHDVDISMLKRQLSTAIDISHLAPGKKTTDKLKTCCLHIMKMTAPLVKEFI